MMAYNISINLFIKLGTLFETSERSYLSHYSKEKLELKILYLNLTYILASY